jgi:hypothetical protein
MDLERDFKIPAGIFLSIYILEMDDVQEHMDCHSEDNP